MSCDGGRRCIRPQPGARLLLHRACLPRLRQRERMSKRWIRRRWLLLLWGWRGRRSRRSQSRRGRWRRVRHGDLLKLELGACVEEGGEGAPATEVTTDVGVPCVEAADEVEDEGAVGDLFPEVTKGIRHALQAPAVLGVGEVALSEGAELGVEDHRPGFLVAKKLRLDGEPGIARSRVALLDGVGEGGGEGAVDP